jgi:ABC-2 type transport system ATP-binding protein
LLSSHLVADLQRTCDHIILLLAGRVRLDGAIEELVASHHRVTGPREARVPGVGPERIVAVSETERQRTQIVRGDLPALHPPDWTFSGVDLEDLLLAYMSPGAALDAAEAMAA